MLLACLADRILKQVVRQVGTHRQIRREAEVVAVHRGFGALVYVQLLLEAKLIVHHCPLLIFLNSVISLHEVVLFWSRSHIVVILIVFFCCL